MKIVNQQPIAFIKNLTKAYTEGIYADTPANRKLGRVGMTYAEYAAKVTKEKEENIKPDKKDLEGNSQENKEKIPFNEPRRGGKAFRLSDRYTLYKSDKNGKISLEIDTVGSKGLSEEEAVELYNNYKENSKEVLEYLDKKYKEDLEDNNFQDKNNTKAKKKDKENIVQIPFNFKIQRMSGENRGATEKNSKYLWGPDSKNMFDYKGLMEDLSNYLSKNPNVSLDWNSNVVTHIQGIPIFGSPSNQSYGARCPRIELTLPKKMSYSDKEKIRNDIFSILNKNSKGGNLRYVENDTIAEENNKVLNGVGSNDRLMYSLFDDSTLESAGETLTNYFNKKFNGDEKKINKFKKENNKKESWSSSRYPSISDIINKENNEYDEEMEQMARREEMRAYHDFYDNGGHFANELENSHNNTDDTKSKSDNLFKGKYKNLFSIEGNFNNKEKRAISKLHTKLSNEIDNLIEESGFDENDIKVDLDSAIYIEKLDDGGITVHSNEENLIFPKVRMDDEELDKMDDLEQQLHYLFNERRILRDFANFEDSSNYEDSHKSDKKGEKIPDLRKKETPQNKNPFKD